jgi:AcrR family transcriptional regulator
VPAARVSQPTRRRRAPRGSGEQLRSEIIGAAKTLLADAGNADEVSIRAVADKVRVTPPSIYLHFADKDALLGAVVADVFADLHAALRAGMAGHDSPLDRLRACGHAYVRFALDHPEQYRLAAMDPCLVAPDVDGVLMDAAFSELSRTVIECMELGIFTAGDPLPISLDLWAAAHGIASLMIAKPYVPWGDAEAVIDRVLVVACLGHVARDLIGEAIDAAAIFEWVKVQRRP